MFKVCVLIISAVILFSESFAQEVAIHELTSALQKIAASSEMKRKCKNDTECLKSQHCMNEICTDPCLGSCGINALCYVKNHKLICKCPRCYAGFPYKECTKLPGLFYSLCVLF